MNIKSILESYQEFTTNYYMNEQAFIDNDIDREIAEEIATEEAIKIIKKGVE